MIFSEFGKNVYLSGDCYFHYPWKITIGDNCAIGKGCQVYPSFQNKDAFVIFEENVMTAPNLIIYGAGHPIIEPQKSHIGQDVVIKKNAYIGGNVVIRYGVTVGESAVVAAGSVVIKDVAPYTVVGGNPAKFISNVPS
jgi:acetyltransferase-like isoleucine patch superfamily enzyme